MQIGSAVALANVDVCW